MAVDESEPFEVETDASEVAIAATLNQNGRPVAFFSRMLQGSELKHPSIEKEAQAIIEAARHWKHYLTGMHVTLRTDQSCYSFDIEYKPGWDNIPTDALSRISCALPNDELLRQLHDALCHPGVTRLAHFIRVRNLLILLQTSNELYPLVKFAASTNRNFIALNQATLSKPRSRFKGPISILKALFLAATKINIY